MLPYDCVLMKIRYIMFHFFEFCLIATKYPIIASLYPAKHSEHTCNCTYVHLRKINNTNFRTHLKTVFLFSDQTEDTQG